MKTRVFFTIAIFSGIFLSCGLNKITAQTHVVLNTFNVNIRTGPGTNHAIVCMAGKGEILELVSTTGDWVEVRMYTADTRYIHKDLVYFLTRFVHGHNMRLPQTEDETHRFYNDIKFAKLKAKKEADILIPDTVSKEYHENYYRICMDEKIHEIFELYGQQTAMYPELVKLAKEKGW